MLDISAIHQNFRGQCPRLFSCLLQGAFYPAGESLCLTSPNVKLERRQYPMILASIFLSILLGPPTRGGFDRR